VSARPSRRARTVSELSLGRWSGPQSEPDGRIQLGGPLALVLEDTVQGACPGRNPVTTLNRQRLASQARAVLTESNIRSPVLI
jgi:hypothetical protein